MTTNDHPTPKNAELYDWDVLQTLKAQQHDSPRALYAYARYALQYGCRTASDDPTTPRNILLRALDAAESAEREWEALKGKAQPVTAEGLLRAAQSALEPYMRYVPGTGSPGVLNEAAQVAQQISVYFAQQEAPHDR